MEIIKGQSIQIGYHICADMLERIGIMHVIMWMFIYMFMFLSLQTCILCVNLDENRSKMMHVGIVGSYSKEHDMDREEYLRKCSNMKCQRVQVDEPFVPALQDEVMEVDHSLSEPRNHHVSVDGVFDIHTTLNGKDDLELEVLDGFLDDVEIDDLEGTYGLSGACEEYILDFEFDNKTEVVGSGPCEGSLLKNASSESHSSGLSGSSIVGWVSDSTKLPIAQSECKDNSLNETVTYESHGAFRNNPSQPSNEDCMYNISLDIPHLLQLDNGHPKTEGTLYPKKEKDSDEKCQSASLREKRFRKPTRRYIEESSNSRSKGKVTTAGTKNKHLSVSPCNELHIKIKELRKIPSEKTSNGNSSVTLPELKVRRGHPKKEKLEYDEEPMSSESEDEFLTPNRSKRKDRRKHQRMWTPDEVSKLVDGISEYGVGRWTHIKRFWFSSSSYRTPIDLRDKWRNLLRASSAQKCNNKECEQNDDLALRPLPFNVACRVRELAEIHPYPRQRGSKKSRFRQVGSSVADNQSKGCPLISVSKRNARRKNST